MADPWAPPSRLRSRTSVKWRTYPPDVLPAFVAEMDVDIAEPIRLALIEAVERGDTGYACGDGYARALSDFGVRRWGWGFDPGQATGVADVMTGVVEAIRLVTSAGDAVVVNSPVYFPFFGFVVHAGRRIVEAPLGSDGRIDFALLEAAFRHAVSGGGHAAYLLCSPHNPTGTVHTRAELEQIAQLAHGYGVRVVADEIHAPLVPPGAVFVPYLTVDDLGIVLASASKAWNLAGIKAALMVGGVRSVDDLRRLPEHVAHGPSHFGTIAHTAALRHGEAWLDSVLIALDANRRLLAELLARDVPGVGYRPPEGTFLTWLDCRGLEIEAAPADFFLQRGRIAFAPGHRFGTGGAGHVRGTIAASPESIADGVARMATALRS